MKIAFAGSPEQSSLLLTSLKLFITQMHDRGFGLIGPRQVHAYRKSEREVNSKTQWLLTPKKSVAITATKRLLPPTGGKQRHRPTIATEHTYLLPRLFFDDNGHSLMSPTVSGCSLVPRPSPPPVIACKNWRRARAENEAKYNTDTSPP